MKKHFFTLIELLTVIALAGILLAIAIPAYQSIAKGKAPDRAAREIMGRLRAARAYAAAKRTATAVIFAANESSNVPASLRFSAYRSCEVYKDGSTWKFIRWIPGDAWTPLPDGIMVGLPQSSFASLTTRIFKKPGAVTYNATVTREALANEAVPGSADGAVTVTGCDISDLSSGTCDFTNAVVFESNGLPVSGCLIELRQARNNGDGTATKTEPDAENNYFPLVLRATGRCVSYPELKSY